MSNEGNTRFTFPWRTKESWYYNYLNYNWKLQQDHACSIQLKDVNLRLNFMIIHD